MSYIMYEVECNKCHKRATTAFGIVGMTIIADPIENCPCGGKFERVSLKDTNKYLSITDASKTKLGKVKRFTTLRKLWNLITHGKWADAS